MARKDHILGIAERKLQRPSGKVWSSWLLERLLQSQEPWREMQYLILSVCVIKARWVGP